MTNYLVHKNQNSSKINLKLHEEANMEIDIVFPRLPHRRELSFARGK